MAEEKRYYWLKLYNDFFTSKRIKKLRKMAGGDTYTIIYLKLQLAALKTDGILTYTGLEGNFAAEIALDIDENENDVAMTLSYLLSVGLAETSDNVNFFFPYCELNTGSEGSSAIRQRACRERKAIANRDNVTLLSQDCHNVSQNCHGEIEKEIEIEIDTRDREEKPILTDGKKNSAPKRFVKPTVEEVAAYCAERKNGVDAERFVDFYESKGWKVGNTPMKDWKAAVRNWENRDKANAAPSMYTDQEQKWVDEVF